jgi:hypothetical protein
MAVITWSDDELEVDTTGSDVEEISGDFVAFTARVTGCSEPIEDSEGGEYVSAEDVELNTLSFEAEFNKLYPKWEALRKVNCKLASEIEIVTNANKVYQTQVADRNVLLKEAADREEKLQNKVQTGNVLLKEATDREEKLQQEV